MLLYLRMSRFGVSSFSRATVVSLSAQPWTRGPVPPITTPAGVFQPPCCVLDLRARCTKQDPSVSLMGFEIFQLSFGKQQHFETKYDLMPGERRKCCKSEGFSFIQGLESHPLSHSLPAPGMKMAILFLPSFCLQAAVLAYPNSLSFSVPLEKSVVYQIVPKRVCFLKYSSRQMQCVLFLIRGAQM